MVSEGAGTCSTVGRRIGYAWGMNRDEICSDFLDALTFEPYPFQEDALLAWFEEEGGVLVTAPTGMGKTLVAEAAIFEALKSGQRLYYTSPLIALTDQKFREFQDSAERWGFARDSVGLITGNRRVNPEAPVKVVVAEILLNHLLTGEEMMHDVSGVVMDEFHYFNDRERGIVWELSLVLLPESVRLMLLSATVGNSVEFVHWLKKQHGRRVRLIKTDQRRVPLAYEWEEGKLLTELLPGMVASDDAENRSPALVFCFNRDECWEVAERLKGLSLIGSDKRADIEAYLADRDLTDGVGPKLRQMLIRGVGVHHAGVLPKHKEVIEELFLRKLIPFVICTETLAAGINLPARSVVLSTLMTGKPREKKLIPPSSAHQMFGRAGRPQFDSQGYVYVIAHDDDVKINKWKKKYEKIDPNSKDPGIMRARKDLERKKPSRRKNVQYWVEGHFRQLIEAGPAKLASRSMIPYSVLIYLLTKYGALHEVRDFLSKRFNTPEWIQKFQNQLDHMIGNLQAFGYLKRGEDADQVTLEGNIEALLTFRSVDPLFGAFCREQLVFSDMAEKLQVLEAMMPLPGSMMRGNWLPDDREIGPLEMEVVRPELLKRGLIVVDGETGGIKSTWDDPEFEDYLEDEKPKRPPSLPEMLEAWFDDRLASPEDVWVQPKWLAGGMFDGGDEFFKYVKARTLVKNEGLVLRHLLRLIILAEEFHLLSSGDPEYAEIGQRLTKICQQVDGSYTDRFLSSQHEARDAASRMAG